MRLWHQSLIPYLDRQHLLGQHRECCALRGKGWGRKHATVDYVFKYWLTDLYKYHFFVMKEMKRRGYNVAEDWWNAGYRGSVLGYADGFNNEDCYGYALDAYEAGDIIYPEHDRAYLIECINLLKQKNAPMDFEKIEKELL